MHFVVRHIVESIGGNTSIDAVNGSDAEREGSAGEWMFAMELLIDHGRTEDALILLEELVDKTPEKESPLKSINPIFPRLNNSSFTVPHKIKWDDLLCGIVSVPVECSAGKSRTPVRNSCLLWRTNPAIQTQWLPQVA